MLGFLGISLYDKTFTSFRDTETCSELSQTPKMELLAKIIVIYLYIHRKWHP